MIFSLYKHLHDGTNSLVILTFIFQGAKLPAENLITKTLDNLVGKLWQQNQARQDSEGSSAGNQVRLKCNWQKYERNNFTIARKTHT